MRQKLALSIALYASISAAFGQLTQLDQDPLPTPEQMAKLNAGKVTPCMVWIDPAIKPKGYILCVHGLGLHKGCFKDFGERMAKLGWGVYAVDVRGFGTFMKMPGGERKLDFEGCLQDVKEALEMIHRDHPGATVILAGESMGGAIALQAAARYPDLMTGLLSSVPAGERKHNDTMKVGMKILAGGAHKDMDVRAMVVDRSTEKAELKEAWLNDDLARFAISPAELMQFQHFMGANHKAAKQISGKPVLIVQGTEDQLVKQEGQVTLWNEMAANNPQLVTLIHIANAEHLILEENQFTDDVINVLCSWLDDNFATKNSSDKIAKPAS